MYAFRIILPISYLELNYAHADSADIAEKRLYLESASMIHFSHFTTYLFLEYFPL